MFLFNLFNLNDKEKVNFVKSEEHRQKEELHILSFMTTLSPVVQSQESKIDRFVILENIINLTMKRSMKLLE